MLEENVAYAVPTSPNSPTKSSHQDQPTQWLMMRTQNQTEANCNATNVGS